MKPKHHKKWSKMANFSPANTGRIHPDETPSGKLVTLIKYLMFSSKSLIFMRLITKKNGYIVIVL